MIAVDRQFLKIPGVMKLVLFRAGYTSRLCYYKLALTLSLSHAALYAGRHYAIVSYQHKTHNAVNHVTGAML